MDEIMVVGLRSDLVNGTIRRMDYTAKARINICKWLEIHSESRSAHTEPMFFDEINRRVDGLLDLTPILPTSASAEGKERV